ncbi:MAG: alpha/beta fold hydrolase [Pseudonocardiaceae bacterium]|nr:alpha/beta fold hydrolase [Pseudonocardiaceae bacterium]
METSQLAPHRGARIDLPGRHGPIAALHAKADGVDPDTTVLLLPGYTGSKEDFAPLLDPIADAGFDVVAVDLPGQYESAGPELESDYLTVPLGATFVELIGKLAADGRKVLLLGHSYGGLVARAAVLAGADVAMLTLLDSGPASLPNGLRRMVLEAADPHLRQHGVHAVQQIREQVAAQAPDWELRSAELKEFLRTRLVRSTEPGLLGMSAGLRTEPDRVDELAAVLRERAIGAHVLTGQNDDAWSLDAQRDMARRLGAPFTTVPGAGHSPNTENPEGLLAVLLPAWREHGAR